MSAAEVRSAVRQASGCPARAAYPGIRFIAFVANRRVPGDQPDAFMLAAAANARFARIAAADGNLCPSRVPEVNSGGGVTVVPTGG